MRLEIDIAEHHYNNIMALDSVCLGRAPYKGIIMYAINAIKHGKVLEQEPRKGHWDKDGACPFCGYFQQWKDDAFCGHCGAQLGEVEE